MAEVGSDNKVLLTGVNSEHTATAPVPRKLVHLVVTHME